MTTAAMMVIRTAHNNSNNNNNNNNPVVLVSICSKKNKEWKQDDNNISHHHHHHHRYQKATLHPLPATATTTTSVEKIRVCVLAIDQEQDDPHRRLSESIKSIPIPVPGIWKSGSRESASSSNRIGIRGTHSENDNKVKRLYSSFARSTVCMHECISQSQSQRKEDNNNTSSIFFFLLFPVLLAASIQGFVTIHSVIDFDSIRFDSLYVQYGTVHHTFLFD